MHHLVAESPDFKEDALTDRVLKVLLQNKIFGSLVSRDFGGVGSCQKDLMRLSEVLGRDLSLFTAVNQYQAAATLITLFGSDQQKRDYLYRLTTFECRPVICLTDEGYVPHDGPNCDTPGLAHLIQPPGCLDRPRLPQKLPSCQETMHA